MVVVGRCREASTIFFSLHNWLDTVDCSKSGIGILDICKETDESNAPVNLVFVWVL